MTKKLVVTGLIIENIQETGNQWKNIASKEYPGKEAKVIRLSVLFHLMNHYKKKD